jgi:hypothetical protein
MNSTLQTNKDSHPIQAVIVGAGISGLLAAHELGKKGISCVILEKSRGVGGRLATRRFENARFDHGAQYFTQRDEALKPYLNQWLEKGWITRWENQPSPTQDEESAYISPQGMTTLAKGLVSSLPSMCSVELGQRVHCIKTLSDSEYRYQVSTEEGRLYQCDGVLMTSPVPQTLDIFKQSEWTLTQEEQDELSNIQYWPCVGLLGLTDTDVNFPVRGWSKPNESILSWVCDNHSKQVSEIGPALIAHADGAWSEAHFEKDDATLEKLLKEAMTAWVNPEQWTHVQIKKWRYALVKNPMKLNYYTLKNLDGIVLSGDGFSGPRVENAALSGIKASQPLFQSIQKTLKR